jgi:hypothetical protein
MFFSLNDLPDVSAKYLVDGCFRESAEKVCIGAEVMPLKASLLSLIRKAL